MAVNRSSRMFHSIGLLLTLLIACQIKENNADDTQKLELNQVYSFFNRKSSNEENDSGLYVIDTWDLEAPDSYKTSLNCSLNVPTENCDEHSIQIIVNPSDDSSLPIIYCGNTNFSAFSKENKIKLMFQTINSKLAVFRCTAMVVSL
ncbi:uncharacterized protein LOC122503968 [Leptopilina heterotoma]|uniref:uncharacterized protein LOC122503968 n=1 Tax=Leptopilina heterotoma TaxID=63436 RepID=UPI001CA91C34|nr:uncharacterized protein LOC122503968 [Leptopilina heterotoma]